MSPVVQVIREVDARDERWGGERLDRDGRACAKPRCDLPRRRAVTPPVHHGDEVALRRVEESEDGGVALATRSVGERADHLERQHEPNADAARSQVGCVHGTPHPLGAEIRRLLERVGHELDPDRGRVRRKHPGQLEQPGNAARIVVGARLIAGRVVVRAHHDPLRRLRADLGEDVAVEVTADAIDLLVDGGPGRLQLAAEVCGGAVQVVGVLEVARSKAGRELVNPGAQRHRIRCQTAAGWLGPGWHARRPAARGQRQSDGGEDAGGSRHPLRLHHEA